MNGTTKRRRSRVDSTASLSHTSKRSASYSSSFSRDWGRATSLKGFTAFPAETVESFPTESPTVVTPPEEKRSKKWTSKLFLTPDSVGAEGAFEEKRKNTHRSKAGPSPGEFTGTDANLLQIRLPATSVIEYLGIKCQGAQLKYDLMWFVPFLVLFTMFAVWGNGDTLNIHFNEEALRRRADIGLYSLWSRHTSIMEEAFKIDSENVKNNNSSPFASGGSKKYPWMYSNYNDVANDWTPQPNPKAAADEQVERVSSVYRDPTFVNLESIRTKRDLMRWVLDTFVPQHWNCDSESYEEPWMVSRRGSQRMVGAVRIRTERRVVNNTCRRKELQGLVSCQARSTSGKISSPPLVPASFCNRGNPANPNETLFDYNYTIKGYQMLLPFTTSCSTIKDSLKIIETEKQDVDWSNGKSYVMMSELWNEFKTDTEDPGCCSSFLFHRSVSHLSLEYVVYAPVIESFMYVSTDFAFRATGTTVKPSMTIYTAPVLSAHVHFTKLALSIALAIYLLYYFCHICLKHYERYKGTITSMRKTQQTALIRVVVLLQQVFQLWSLFLLLAMVFTFADLVALWWMWGRVDEDALLKYEKRFDFPQPIADYCKETAPLRAKLLAAASFFVYLSSIRYCTLFSRLWMILEAIYNALERVLGLVILWMLMIVSLSVCCIILFGEVNSEFGSISAAYDTLLLMYIDRGKWLFTHVGWDSGTSDFSTTVPSSSGSLLKKDKTIELTYMRNKMYQVSPAIYQLIYYTFNFIFIFLVNSWIIAVLTESYEQVTNQNKTVIWGTTDSLSKFLREIRRSLSLKFFAEAVRRLLWARRSELLYADVANAIRLNLERRGKGESQADPDDDVYMMTYSSLLWILPRELQAEFGPHHLRKLWQSCADYVETLVQHDTNAVAQQWRRHWERCEDGIQGWLSAVVPKEVDLESKAVEVGILLDELPPKILKYVEKYGVQ